MGQRMSLARYVHDFAFLFIELHMIGTDSSLNFVYIILQGFKVTH